MKHKLIIIILAVFPLITFGQNKNLNRDTLIIEVDNNVIVKINSYESAWLKDYEDLPLVLNKFRQEIILITDSIPKSIPIRITYKSDSYLKYNQIISNEKILSANSTYFSECKIITDRYDIYFRYADLSELLDSNINNCIITAINHEIITEKGNLYLNKFDHISWTDYCDCNADTVTFNYSKWNPHKSELSIKLGVGIGVVKNEISPDFGLRIGHYRTTKGILKHNVYLSDNLMYTFQPENKMVIHNFINVGYRYNLSNQIDKYSWIGFEIGYLTNGQDLFETPTFRLSTLIGLHKYITISPQIYFENGFKKVYPGLRIGIDIGQ